MRQKCWDLNMNESWRFMSLWSHFLVKVQKTGMVWIYILKSFHHFEGQRQIVIICSVWWMASDTETNEKYGEWKFYVLLVVLLGKTVWCTSWWNNNKGQPQLFCGALKDQELQPSKGWLYCSKKNKKALVSMKFWVIWLCLEPTCNHSIPTITAVWVTSVKQVLYKSLHVFLHIYSCAINCW